MANGVSAWVIPLLTAVIGGIAGHFISIGRDRRKERNEARLPIWGWFKDNPPGNGTKLSDFILHHKNDLKKYEYQVPKSEWRKFQKHYDAIHDLSKKVRSAGFEITTYTQVHAVELTQAELDKVSKHWQAIIRLTRHRG